MVLQKKFPPSQLFSGAIPWRGTSRKLSLDIVTVKNTNLPSVSVSTSVTASRLRWSRKSISFVWLSPGEKKMGPINYFLYGVFDHGWYGLQLKYWWLFLVSARFRCQILLQGISGGSNTVIYVLALAKLEEKISLIQFHVLPCN